jgi:hypothetical protein
MRKVKKLEQEIKELREQRFNLMEENSRLRTNLMCEEGYRKDLKKEILLAQNKYIEEVQNNVALADIIVSLRQKLEDAKGCGYVE